LQIDDDVEAVDEEAEAAVLLLNLRNDQANKDARARKDALAKENKDAREKAKDMHSLYLPDGDGRFVVPLWPHMDSLTTAGELGRALGAITKNHYTRDYTEEDNITPTAGALDWKVVYKDVTTVNERFGDYADLVLRYGDLMIQGNPLNDLFEVPVSMHEHRAYVTRT
jgi:hypothetical protein